MVEGDGHSTSGLHSHSHRHAVKRLELMQTILLIRTGCQEEPHHGQVLRKARPCGKRAARGEGREC